MISGSERFSRPSVGRFAMLRIPYQCYLCQEIGFCNSDGVISACTAGSGYGFARTASDRLGA
jgi:hypothetical protein